MTDHVLIADQDLRQVASSEVADSPSEYAEQLHASYLAAASDTERRDLGQFFTPVTVARKMAELADTTEAADIRILEPGAGAAILTAALCERLASRVRTIHIDA